MKMTYTTAEARKVLHVDAKTFDRWLEQAGMQPQISRWNHRIKHFTQEQVVQLAEEHRQFIPMYEALLVSPDCY